MKCTTTTLLPDRTFKLILVIPIIMLMLALLSGCERPGPAERAGEQIDEAVEEVGEAVDEAVDDPGY